MSDGEREKEKWAVEVLELFADNLEANAGNTDALILIFKRDADKVVKALLYLVKPGYRRVVGEWIERVTTVLAA